MPARTNKYLTSLMNLLVPGLGHFYWKEYSFGLFVFLITLVAILLFIATFFIDIPIAGKLAMYGLPAIFYLFTFVDLEKSRKTKLKTFVPSIKRFRIYLFIGVAIQLLVPVAPLNFALRNSPELFTINSANLEPYFHKGDIVKASRLSYKIDFFFLSKPVLHALPERYEIVRVRDKSDNPLTGMVLGLPGENIEIYGNTLYIDDYPESDLSRRNLVFEHDWPLTSVGSYSIMVADLRKGAIDRVFEVPVTQLTGKVSKLF